MSTLKDEEWPDLNLGSPSGASTSDDMWPDLDLNSMPSSVTQPVASSAATPATASTPKEGKDYSQAPWSEVLSAAPGAALSQSGEVAAGIGHMVAHPVSTVQNLAGAAGQIGQGLYSKAQGYMGVQQDPQDKANTEALVNQIGEHFAQYGSEGGVKNMIAKEPLTPLFDASTLLTGAGGVAAKLPMVSKLGEAAEAAGAAVNPIEMGLKAARGASNAVMSAANGPLAASTGTPYKFLQAARTAGASNNPELQAAYKGGLSGEIGPPQIVDKINAALGSIKDDRDAAYVAQKNQQFGGNLPNISWKPVQASIDNAISRVQTSDAGSSLPTNSQGLSALMAVKSKADELAQTAAANPSSLWNNLIGHDAFKKFVGDQMGNYMTPGATGALQSVYSDVVNNIASQHPDYLPWMKDYADATKNMQDLKTLLGNGKMPTSRQFGKVFNTFKKGTGEDLLSQVTNKDETIPYALAGYGARHWTPEGFMHNLAGPLEIGAALFHPVGIPGAAGVAAATSPKLASLANNAVGRLQGLSSKYLTPAVTSGAYQAQNAPPTFAKGGSVKGKHKHEALVQRLLDLAEKAKKDTKKETKPLLKQPDAAIIKALAVAKAAI